MGNLGRVLRLALANRFTLLAALLCAIGTSVLWGGNISAIYPVVEVAFQRQSFQDWVAKQLHKAQLAEAEARAEIKRLEEQLPRRRRRGRQRSRPPSIPSRSGGAQNSGPSRVTPG